MEERVGAGALVGRNSPEQTWTASRNLYVLANAWRWVRPMVVGVNWGWGGLVGGVADE